MKERHVPRNVSLSRWDWLVIMTAGLVLLDGVMTLPNWSLEGNPIVLFLGPVGMLTVKLLGVTGFVSLWFRNKGIRTYKVTKACVACLSVLYGVVVVSNVAVLLLL